MAWALSPALAAAAAADSEVFVPAQLALCCCDSHARQETDRMCRCKARSRCELACSMRCCKLHAPTAARAVVAAVAALDAAAAAAVARMAPLLNCGSAVGAAPAVGASCQSHSKLKSRLQPRTRAAQVSESAQWESICDVLCTGKGRILACSRLRRMPTDACRGDQVLPSRGSSRGKAPPAVARYALHMTCCLRIQERSGCDANPSNSGPAMLADKPNPPHAGWMVVNPLMKCTSPHQHWCGSVHNQTCHGRL